MPKSDKCNDRSCMYLLCRQWPKKQKSRLVQCTQTTISSIVVNHLLAKDYLVILLVIGTAIPICLKLLLLLHLNHHLGLAGFRISFQLSGPASCFEIKRIRFSIKSPLLSVTWNTHVDNPSPLPPEYSHLIYTFKLSPFEESLKLVARRSSKKHNRPAPNYNFLSMNVLCFTTCCCHFNIPGLSLIAKLTFATLSKLNNTTSGHQNGSSYNNQQQQPHLFVFIIILPSPCLFLLAPPNFCCVLDKFLFCNINLPPPSAINDEKQPGKNTKIRSPLLSADLTATNITTATMLRVE